MLDYGSGRGFDADYYDMDAYDPFWNPDEPEGPYDVITCSYVLNVIPDKEERDKVVNDLVSLLDQEGTAFIAVRNDKDQLNGHTSIGTWQGYVTPCVGELVEENSSFRMYRVNK